MAGEVVLRSAAAAASGLCLLASLLATSMAAAQDDAHDSDLHRPKRLTVGVADDLLGQLSPDGNTLYFVSNRDTIHQLYAQSLSDGRARQLFDDDADVTWPRVSPDGRSILYISFREHASGQLCIRRLPDGEARRCLDDPSAALQAEWTDSTHIALVARQSIQGDLRVLRVTVVGSTLSASVLLERNLTSPAVSPDGRWLVYVPVARTVESVGPAFAAHAATHLEAVALGSTEPATSIALALPGQTGQPSFARDGRSLYVVQFIADTNQDGTVDAGDHGVLFRVPLSFESGVPVPGVPEQLTETSWNCEYPAPFVDRLITTCSKDSSLDVYSLPLDGEVPAEWTAADLGAEMENAGTRVEQQLLAARRLARETTPAGRQGAMLALVLLHLEREEFLAAQFYAEQLEAMSDASTAGISLPLKILVDQRKAERRREQGRLTEGFKALAQQRLKDLGANSKASPMAEDLWHLVRSVIAESIGDKTQGRAELEAVTVDETTPRPVMEAYYQHADAVYRDRGDRDALEATCRELAANPALSADQQLRYARAAVRAVVRGLSYADADAALVRERGRVTEREPEMLFAVDLARAVLAVRDAHAPQPVVDALLSVYASQTRPGRRRALMEDAVVRADALDADGVLEALAQRDIQDVARGTRERVKAERLFRRIFTGRAYDRVAAKRYDDARADFDAIADQTGSLEAVAGAIDMRLKVSQPPAGIEAFYARPGTKPMLTRFAKAYLLARQLPKLEGTAHASAAAAALAALDASWPELKEQRIAQALFGALLHEEYVETGDLATAERANLHYLVALELMGQNVRFRAMILGELGILHDDVGNYRIALGYLLDRDKLPYTDNAEGLDVHLSEAQALLHVGRDGEAATAAEQALATIDRNPALAKYRLLALDSAALYNLSAGRFARSLTLYAEEIPLADALDTPLATRSRFVVRVGHAAAAVGAGDPARALADLDVIDARLGDPKLGEKLAWPHATAPHVVQAYRLIAEGLRANASRQLGRLDAEAQAIAARCAILDDQLRESGRDEVVQARMLAEAQLALNASERHDPAGAGSWLAKALADGDDLHRRALGVSDRAQLDVVWLAAALTVQMGAPLVSDLSKRLEKAMVEMGARHEPWVRRYQAWFEIYGVLVASSPALAAAR
jgi:hypothetical protein